MKQKNAYRGKSGRPSNVRPDTWPKLPLGLLLTAVVLFVAVLVSERWRGNHPAYPIANARPNDIAAPSAPSTGKSDPVLPAENQQKTTKPPGMVTAGKPIPSRPPPANQPQSPMEQSEETFQYVMERDSFGNILGFGLINGKNVRFLADTGANVVVVPEKIAAQIGLNKGAPISFKTGGGVIVHYATTLDTLTLGKIEMRNVAAAINPAMQDNIVLLGMSALGLLNMHMEDGSLVLQYRATIPTVVERQPVKDEPFKRSYKECVGQSNKFDQKTLDCMRANIRQ